MHMHDWNAYRQQISAGVGELGKLSPDTVRGYVIAEALGVAISVNAGAALVYTTSTLDAFAAAQEG